MGPVDVSSNGPSGSAARATEIACRSDCGSRTT